MTELMRWTLDSFHGVPPHRVAVIPHGVPDINPLRRRSQGTPRQPIFPGRPVIMTNGLMHQYKGIEYMLEAMPAVLEHHPRAVYLIDGKPHPGGWGVQGYYSGLKKKASELGLVQRGAVVFNNEFSGYDALLMKLEAAAVYVNPYTDVTQSVSGTVAMALAAGAAVVSTPYPYALEALAGDVGVFVPFRDSDALARAITALLSDPTRIVQHNRRAWAYARNMTWQLVAQQHLDVASAMR
jgi:glycosyltransferase involved in cell wall biosynthesis